MTVVKQDDAEGGKSMENIAVSAKRPTKKKPKDKPKRPLSAYNFFFKEEREKILKVILSDESRDTVNEPDSDDFINEGTLGRLRKEGGKVSFEEMGKLIGQRWKNLQPDRLTKYSELAAEDTDRYKKEMQGYNGRQEAKMRSEALKPQSGGYQGQDTKVAANMPRPQMPAYDMTGANSAYGGAPPMQVAYGYPGMEYGGYPGMAMGAMYGYGGYPGMGPMGAQGGPMPPGAGPETTHPGQMVPPEMQGGQQGPEYARTPYGGAGGYQGGMVGYGGPPPPQYHGQMPPGAEYPQGPGMYGYGAGQGWGAAPYG
jgi:hypothetical protein